MPRGAKPGAIWVTDGTFNRRVGPSEGIPEGFREGYIRRTNVEIAQDGGVSRTALLRPAVTARDVARQTTALTHPAAVFRQTPVRSRVVLPPVDPEAGKSDEEILDRIRERFDVIRTLTELAVSGHNHGMIVSGGPGLSKSYTVETTLANWDKTGKQYTIVRGVVRALDMYIQLWEHRHSRQVLVFDDADQIFSDEKSLNILKAACDTTKKRTLFWLTQFSMTDSKGNPVPKRFDFEGSVIFITNKDFDSIIETDESKDGKKRSALRDHLKALMSRSHYVNTTLHTRRAAGLWCKEIERQGKLLEFLTQKQRDDVMTFFDNHFNDLKMVDLRMLLKIGVHRATNSPVWERNAKIDCLREAK